MLMAKLGDMSDLHLFLAWESFVEKRLVKPAKALQPHLFQNPFLHYERFSRFAASNPAIRVKPLRIFSALVFIAVFLEPILQRGFPGIPVITVILLQIDFQKFACFRL